MGSLDSPWPGLSPILTSQYVKFNNVTSNMESSPIGVPQGTILGPILFLLYVNDFAQCLKQCKCIMYADDTTIYFGSDNLDLLQTTMQGPYSGKSFPKCRKPVVNTVPTLCRI